MLFTLFRRARANDIRVTLTSVQMYTTENALPGPFVIDSVPQALQVACHHGDAQTNKPTKRDDRAYPLISPLHNADKA